jgi:NAD(P)H dehydrogenase (quinone)
VLTWSTEASWSGLQHPHSGTPRPSGASTPSGPILIGEGHAGAIYNVTGSKAYTGAERAALISEITGKSVGFVTVPADALRAGMTKAGLPEGVINSWVSIQNDFAAGAFDIVTGDVELLAGRAPKSLRDALSAALR